MRNEKWGEVHCTGVIHNASRRDAGEGVSVPGLKPGVSDYYAPPGRIPISMNAYAAMRH